MEELTYLRTKKCACCYERLDKMPKRNIVRVKDNDADFLTKLNTVKPNVLLKKRKLYDDVQIQINDLICGSCRLTAKRVKSDHVQLPSSTSSVPGIYPTLPSIASASAGPYIPGTGTTMTTITTDTATQTKSKYFDDNLGEIDSITLKIPRSMINNKNCLICNNKSKSLINVPKDAYLDT